MAENRNSEETINPSDELLYNEITTLNNDLVNLQRELVQKNRKLEELVEQKNYFLGMAAHDLRSPLANISMLAETLIEEDLNPALRRQYLELIQSLNTYMLDLVSDFLDFSQTEAGTIHLEMTENHLADLLEEVILLNQKTSDNRNIQLILEMDGDTEKKTFYFDYRKIKQVISNLVSNAVKYSKQGSDVRIRTETDGKALRISVYDSGPGIDDSEKDKLFRPFSKTSNQPPGGERSTGLGLYISKKLIDAHSGVIDEEKNPCGGSIFFITLPLRTADD